MYSVDFGAKIGPDEKFRRYEAVRNCTTKLNDIVGKFIYNSGLIFSMIDAG
jgi:hypothetical protein